MTIDIINGFITVNGRRVGRCESGVLKFEDRAAFYLVDRSRWVEVLGRLNGEKNK